MKKQSFTLVSMLLALNVAAHAQPAQPSAMAITASKPVKKPSPFHISATLEQNSNLMKNTESGRAAETNLDLIPSVDLTSDVKLGARSIITHKNVQDRATTLSNTQVNLGIKGPQFTKEWGSSFLVRGIAPTNEEARERQSFQGAGVLGASAIWTNQKTTFSYSINGTRNFHEYTVNADDSPNIRYGFGQEMKLSIEFYPKWSFATVGAYYQGWTYHDFSRQIYAFAAELGYDITKAWNVAVGFETNGDVFRPNGTDTNIKFFDENISVIRASVTFTN